MRLHLQARQCGLPFEMGYMSVSQLLLVVKTNLLSILMPAKVVKIFEPQKKLGIKRREVRGERGCACMFFSDYEGQKEIFSLDAIYLAFRLVVIKDN